MIKDVLKDIGIFILIISLVLIAPKLVDQVLTLSNENYRSSKKKHIWHSRLAEFHLDLPSDWEKIKIDKELQIPQIKINDWSYPWHIIRHIDGHFENTFGEPIKHSDTLKLKHNSNCFSYALIYDEPRSRLKFAKAIRSKDTLKINLFDHSASNWESLSYLIIKDRFKSNYKTFYMFDYIDIEFHQKKSHLILNGGPPFSIGQTIKGKVYHEVEEQILITKDSFSEKSGRIIKGTFEVKIE